MAEPIKLTKLWTDKPTHNISVLLPTRGRTDALKRSLVSLIEKSSNPTDMEIILGFDNDDQDSIKWCKENIFPVLEEHGIDAIVIEFTPMGYIRLHEYLNAMAGVANGSWLMFWNDDAVMETQDWDLEIAKYNDRFLCLRMKTHNEHPYAIFPIVPRDWFYLLGHLSNHQLTDATISQMSYILGIMQNLDVWVVHDRYDITGNNQDDTYKNRPMLEGNHNDPRDFNHANTRNKRFADCTRIAWYLERIGQPSQWFKDVMTGKQDPWTKMLSEENDPNKQVKIYE